MSDLPEITATQTSESVRHRKKNHGVIEMTGADGLKKLVKLEEMNEADAQLAAEFGYKPVFKREFGYLSTFSFAVSISGLFATIMTTFSYPLYAGGSSAAVWCWLISGAGCMCIAVSSGLPRVISTLLTRRSALLPSLFLRIQLLVDCISPFLDLPQRSGCHLSVGELICIRKNQYCVLIDVGSRAGSTFLDKLQVSLLLNMALLRCFSRRCPWALISTM
jgi:hypothetical protein